MEQGKVEPTLAAQGEAALEPGVDLDSVGQSPEPPQNQNRSWGAVGDALGKNRGALIILGVAALAAVVFVVQKSRNQVTASTSDTSVAIAVPFDQGRNSDSERVAELDAAVEAQALEKAREIGGSYMPPLATDTAKLPPLPTAPVQIPAANMPKIGGSGSASEQEMRAKADAERKRAEAIEKAIGAQLGRVTSQVYRGGSKPGVATSDEAVKWAATQASLQQPGLQPADSNVSLGYPMGTIWGATLITGADTDRPGVVRAQIEEGPFAGREALCSFDWASREYLSLECFAVKLDTESFPIKMIAVDSDTMPNLKAEYDGRYIKRLGGQFLAAFPAAYAEGLSQGGTVTQGVGGTTTTEKELAGKDLTIYAAGRATEPLLKEAQQIANEIRPRASVPPMQSIGLMLAEDI